MLTTEDYLTYWAMYLIGALGLLVVWWFITKKIPNKLVKDGLRLSVAVLLLMPFPVLNHEQFWAPAVGMTFLEIIFGQNQSIGRTGIPLLIVWAFSLAFYLLVETLWSRFKLKRQESSVEHATLMKEHDDMVAEAKET